MVKFYKCALCGSVVAKLNEQGCNPSCCGQEMKELRVGTVEAAVEKHIPAVKEEGGKLYVQVGSTIHPMDPDHYIEWVYLLTDKEGRFHFLKPGDEPKCVFALADNEVPLEVYAYCNKHGLWKADVE